MPRLAIMFHRLGPYHFARCVAAMTEAQRAAMAAAGRRIIAEWGPERFADGVMRGGRTALRRQPPPAAWFDQALLRVLAHRRL